jgi:hypothetical protein
VRSPSTAPRRIELFGPSGGQWDYCGFCWFARTKRGVTFESWCERDYLIALDFDPSVRWVAKQPFTTRFAAAEGDQQKHTPDFFVRSVSGEGG